MKAMKKQYGKKAEEVFYASKNKGTIKGVDKKKEEILKLNWQETKRFRRRLYTDENPKDTVRIKFATL